jgi:hypothetical protein
MNCSKTIPLVNFFDGQKFTEIFVVIIPWQLYQVDYPLNVHHGNAIFTYYNGCSNELELFLVRFFYKINKNWTVGTDLNYHIIVAAIMNEFPQRSEHH